MVLPVLVQRLHRAVMVAQFALRNHCLNHTPVVFPVE
jgi:hypothetical protein